MAPIEIQFNIFGPTGPHTGRLTSCIGRATRNYVSPTTKKWKEVPCEVREKVWDVVSKARDGKSPNRITLWLDTHTRKDGNPMNPHVDAVKALHDSIPELAKKNLDHDPVASILGPDSRGHVTGLGFTTSKSRVRNTAPYLNKIQKQHATQETMQESMNKLTQIVRNLEENFRNSQTTHSHSGTHSTDPNVDSTSQDPSTAASSIQQGGRCRLMWRQEIAVEGRLSKTHTDKFIYEIIVDEVFLPDVLLPEEEGSLGTAVGSIIQWPINKIVFY